MCLRPSDLVKGLLYLISFNSISPMNQPAVSDGNPNGEKAEKAKASEQNPVLHVVLLIFSFHF